MANAKKLYRYDVAWLGRGQFEVSEDRHWILLEACQYLRAVHFSAAFQV